MYSTANHPPNPDPGDKEAARQARVDAIRSGAITRQQMGILWQHRRGPDGGHVVFTFDRDGGQMMEFCGATLEAAITAAKAGKAGR